MRPHNEFAKLPDEVRARLATSEDDMRAAGLLADMRGQVVALRPAAIEARMADDAEGVGVLTGYALTWDTWYDVAGGAPYGWSERIARGAVSKSLAERDDTRFLLNHEGLTLGRWRGQSLDTMSLTPDDIGLRVDVSLDVEHNALAAALYSAVDRGDIDQMSWAFQAMRQEWNDDYTERSILEARLFDVSAVTYPANPATIIGARSATPVVERSGFPLSLAIAQAAALG